jgi:2-methylcitrate dehydratase PrpD
LLAQAGFSSSRDVLESPSGYAAALFAGDVDWGAITDGLGTTYRLTDPGFEIKRFPAHIYMQRSIEATLNLREEHDLTISDLELLTVETSRPGYGGSRAPAGLAGKFSLPHCTAIALLDGKVTIDSFTNDRYFSPDVQLALDSNVP